jgi:2-polyprenyl-3-methyl-5-hydroxy-6-metoxy-1,4-benzoquinol methylase
MRRPDFGRRSTAAERMDTDCADFADYRRCLRDLSRVNLVTRTYAPTLRWLSRQTLAAGERFSLLDVGFGYGDMLRRIRAWADRRGLKPELHGIDLNAWAAEAARAATPDGAVIRYATADLFAFDPQRRYDFIISAQFAHHLTDERIIDFIRWMERHAVRGWFISDLHRHPFPYYGFPLLARAAVWHRFVRTDGQVSIARSFVPRDWAALAASAGLASGAVQIRWHVPFRLTVGRVR